MKPNNLTCNRLTLIKSLIANIKKNAPIDFRLKQGTFETLKRFGLEESDLEELDQYFKIKKEVK